VPTIVPIVLPDGGWQKFPELTDFHKWDYPTRASRPEVFDLLAKGIAGTRHGKGS
jgi:hypothetical protein